MNLQDLANFGEFIGGLVVIVSLAYLSIQVRQNTQSIRTENYARALDRISAIQAQMSRDDAFSTMFSRGAADPSALTHPEEGSSSPGRRTRSSEPSSSCSTRHSPAPCRTKYGSVGQRRRGGGCRFQESAHGGQRGPHRSRRALRRSSMPASTAARWARPRPSDGRNSFAGRAPRSPARRRACRPSVLDTRTSAGRG